MSERITALKARVQEFNKETTGWGKNVHTMAKGALISEGVESGKTKQSHNLIERFKVNFHKVSISGNIRNIYRIGFGFPSTGAYLHYGVGRGYNRVGGKTVRTAKNPTNNPRRPFNWFNPIVNAELPKMDPIVEQLGEDFVLNMVNITLPENE